MKSFVWILAFAWLCGCVRPVSSPDLRLARVAPAAVNAVPSPQWRPLLPKPTNTYSTRIARRQRDGLHAFISSGGLFTWKNLGELSHNVIASHEFCHSMPDADFAGEKLICADIGIGIGIDGPLRIVEIDVETLEISPPFFVGNNANRQPVVRGFPDGSCVVVSYTMESTDSFDIAYRSAITGQWSAQRHVHDAPGFIPASCWTVARGTDGLIYVFGIHDGGSKLMLFRFGEGPFGLVFIDQDTRFIHSYPHNGVYDPLAPMTELPWLHAQTDYARGRVVIVYQEFAYTWQCGNIQSKTQVVGVYPDKTKTLVGRIDEWSGHGNPAYLFPRPDGVYYSLTFCRNCENFERFLFGGFTAAGSAQAADGPACHPFLAASVDGWIVRRQINPDWSETFEIGKLPLPPRVTIKSLGEAIEVRWDQETVGDVLEQSADMKEWINVYVGSPPVYLAVESAQQFFRVKQ
jgi:hypothetical protein